MFGDEVGAETIGRSGRQRRRVVVGHLRLDDVGEACSGPLLGLAFHHQRTGLDLVLQFDVARGQDVRDLVGGRKIDAAERRRRDLLSDGRPVDGGGDVGRHSTVGVVEAARAPPLPAVELGERHLAPVVTVDGIVDAHREQFTLGLVEEAGTDLNERTRDPTGLRSVVPLGRIEELLARVGQCRPGHYADREGDACGDHARPHRGRESSCGAGGDPHVVACLPREAQAQDDGANNCNEERSVDHRVTAVAEEHGEHEDRGGRGDGLGHRPESERSPVGEHRSPPERKPCRGDEAPEGLYRCLLEFEGVPRRFEVGAQQIKRLASRDDRSRCLGKQHDVANNQHARRTDHGRDPHPETSASHDEGKEVGGNDDGDQVGSPAQVDEEASKTDGDDE